MEATGKRMPREILVWATSASFSGIRSGFVRPARYGGQPEVYRPSYTIRSQAANAGTPPIARCSVIMQRMPG